MHEFLAALSVAFIIAFWPLYVCPGKTAEEPFFDTVCYEDIQERGLWKHFTEPAHHKGDLDGQSK